MSWTPAQIEQYNLTQPADYNMVKDLFKNNGYTIFDHCDQPRRDKGYVPNYQRVFTHITKSDRRYASQKNPPKWKDHHCHFKSHVYENKDMTLVCPSIHYKNAIGDRLDWKINEKSLKYLDICSYSRIEVINLIKQISDVIDNIASSC